MADIQLKVSVTRLAKFERDTGVGISEAFKDNGLVLASLVDLVKACSGATDEQIDEYVEEHGFDALASKLTAAMEKSGFLAKTKTAVQAK